MGSSGRWAGLDGLIDCLWDSRPPSYPIIRFPMTKYEQHEMKRLSSLGMSNLLACLICVVLL